MSKRSQEREKLALQLAAGEITQTRYDERIARMKHHTRGAGHLERRRLQRAKNPGLTSMTDSASLTPLPPSGAAPLKPTHVRRAAVTVNLSAPLGNPSGAAPLINREASARGGRAKTAKLDALAKARTARRDNVELRRRGLNVPAVFAGALDFLRLVAELSGKRNGGRAELARLCGVSTSTVSKWLASPPKKVPTQANLDKLFAWHRGLLGDDAKPAIPGVATATSAAIKGTPSVSLQRLNEDISARLKKTARLRNLDPLKLAEQILDRHLPKRTDLD